MTNQRPVYDVELVSDLNDLIQLDRDATEAYTVAINTIRNDSIRDRLVENRADHQRHVEALAGLVRGRGAMAIELPHITGPIKLAVQAMGGATMRDANVLLALRVVEGQVREQYARYGSRKWPEDVEAVVRGSRDDEERHYRWVIDTLRDLGYGDQTLAGSVGAAAEALHKLVASPIEAVSKQFMRFVDQNRPQMPMWRDHDVPTVVARFRDALRALETSGEIEGMVSLFSPDAVLTSPLVPEPAHGADGARAYWNAHRAAAEAITTDITHVTDASGSATLEWTSRGQREGADVSWKGVTVLQHHHGRITRLQSFFDPAPLRVPQDAVPTSAAAAP